MTVFIVYNVIFACVAAYISIEVFVYSFLSQEQRETKKKKMKVLCAIGAILMISRIVFVKYWM